MYKSDKTLSLSNQKTYLIIQIDIDIFTTL